MISVVINGILFGLLLAIMLGPVFFALLQNSVVKGVKAGIAMALGITVADTCYIFLMYFSVKLFKNNPTISFLMGAVGGLIILISGISSLYKKASEREQQVKTRKRGLIGQFLKGFALNGINPFVLLYWLGVMTMVTVNYEYQKHEVIAFFVALITTLLATDLTKVFLANKLRRFITIKRIMLLNKVVGIALILFSLRLFYYAFEHWSQFQASWL